MIDEFVSVHEQRTISFTSMGHLNYLSTLKKKTTKKKVDTKVETMVLEMVAAMAAVSTY